MRKSRWVLAAYLAVIIFGLLAALPNFLSPSHLASLPGWLPKQPVTLGLDLRGGSHLVLETDTKALLKDRIDDLQRQARQSLTSAGIA
ncbi:MAG: protein translocase subunit SecDF, partial [Pannonibacter indicus]